MSYNKFITLKNMNKTTNVRNYHSQSGFVLINGSTKQEEPVKWQWLTHRGIKPETQKKLQPIHQRFSYSEKKSILSDMKLKVRSTSSFKIREGFSRNQKNRISTTTADPTSRPDKKLQSFMYINANDQQSILPSSNFGINEEQLFKKMYDAKINNKCLLAVITIRRMGLRYKLNHSFITYCCCNKNNHESHDLKDISNQVKILHREVNYNQKQLYFYHLNGSPLHKFQEIINSNVSMIIVDPNPKINISYDIHSKIIDLAQIIEKIMTKFKKALSQVEQRKRQLTNINQQEQMIYDWQKIKDVKIYVDKLSENPFFQTRKEVVQKSDLAKWYDQKYEQPQQITKTVKQSDKNLLFESKTHYPNEMINKKLLAMASQKVQHFPTTINNHKFIHQRTSLMMEYVKREDEQNQKNNQIQNKISYLKKVDPPFTKRDMLNYIDKKNSLLANQNIPYLIQKYGLNRFELYNLYNLYKSFEKVALMRNPGQQTLDQVMAKGIDRQTFQVGLKGLDMNPGDQLIKNICYFGDHINWQQFIKIISISLRKTPQEKLTAILKGISSFDNGYLTRHQISLMIGNSLQKLFDKQEIQLKEYFTDMAMKQFDQNKTGKVAVDILKAKVLSKGSQNLTMVSFLILNT